MALGSIGGLLQSIGFILLFGVIPLIDFIKDHKKK